MSSPPEHTAETGRGISVTPTALRLIVGDEELLVERAVSSALASARAADPDAELRRVAAATLP